MPPAGVPSPLACRSIRVSGQTGPQRRPLWTPWNVEPPVTETPPVLMRRPGKRKPPRVLRAERADMGRQLVESIVEGVAFGGAVERLCRTFQGRMKELISGAPLELRPQGTTSFLSCLPAKCSTTRCAVALLDWGLRAGQALDPS